MRIRRVLLLAVCMMLLSAGLAQAVNTITFGGNYSYPIDMTGPVGYRHAGGSIDTSYLNGSQLAYLYRVNVDLSVEEPVGYELIDVNTSGLIYGNPINNANQVAWLLTHYGVSGQGDQPKALQASIWHVFDANYALDTGSANNATFVTLYNNMLADLAANYDPSVNLIGNYYWITLGTLDSKRQLVNVHCLVAPVPIPSAMVLLGSGLAGLVGIGRFRRKRSR